ncbi:MAG TPA: hypothetical protein VKS60_13880, partial [Stellaceae bacterium]|nr:hypothetical protein [Stellaceae bacterium]
MSEIRNDMGSLLGAPAEPEFTYPRSAAMLTVLRYQLIIPALLIFVICAAALMPGVAANILPPGLLQAGIVQNWMRTVARDPAIGYFGLAAGVLSAANAIWLPRKVALSMLPFSVTDEGVYAFMNGKPWRFMPWGEIGSITKTLKGAGVAN